jgi:hypothetical protein
MILIVKKAIVTDFNHTRDSGLKNKQSQQNGGL